MRDGNDIEPFNRNSEPENTCHNYNLQNIETKRML